MIRPTIHPPTHQTKHPPMGGEVSTNFKSANRIEISSFVQVLLWFNWFWGYPHGGWVGGGGVTPRHIHICMHACPHMCTHTCMPVKHDKHGCLHGGGHLQFPNIFILAFCVCACMPVCVHMSRNTRPHVLRCSQPICPLWWAAESHRQPKSPNVCKSWTNWDNLILFKKSLPLNIPGLI